MSYTLKDLTGQQIGYLTVINKTTPHYAKNGKMMSRWHCRCKCGNEIDIYASSVKTKGTMSCGCAVFNEEKQSEIGLHLYDIYKQMVHRCYAPSYKDYKNYGARGISICDEWFDYTQDYNKSNHRFKFNDDRYHAFYTWGIKNNYIPGMTLDRIDNNGNYTPQNCRWTDMKTQTNNKRTNRILVVNGKEYTLSNLAEKYNMSPEALSYRLDQGMTPKEAVTKPMEHHPKRFYTINGETHCVSEWSRIANIPTTTVRERLKRGWSITDALYTPRKQA